MNARRFIPAVALALAGAAPASAGPKEDALWQALRARIEQTGARLEGVLGVSVKDLKTGATIEILPEEPFPQASVIKNLVRHKYLMPLDPAMRARIARLAKPYPKRAK